MSTAIDCHQALAMLQDWLREEAAPESARQLEAHLLACNACRGHAEFETRFRDLIERAAGSDGCPEAVRGRLLAALRSAQAR